jgi:hypothetical protein
MQLFGKMFSENRVVVWFFLLWPINFSPFGIKRQKRRNLEAFNKKDVNVTA